MLENKTARLSYSGVQYWVGLQGCLSFTLWTSVAHQLPDFPSLVFVLENALPHISAPFSTEQNEMGEGGITGFNIICNVFMLQIISKANTAQKTAVTELGVSGSGMLIIPLYSFLYFRNTGCISLSHMPRSRSILDFRFKKHILGYWHILSKITWECDPALNAKLICFIYTLYMQPEGNFTHFWCICVLTTKHPMWSGMRLSSCGVVSVL